MKLFLPQTTLETWVIAEKADLKEGQLWVAEGGAMFPLAPAVHFRGLASGADERKLVGKVKTQPQLEALGAEHLMDSVLLGDDAYEVTNGYVAQVGPAGKGPARPGGESELLAAFLLEKLT